MFSLIVLFALSCVGDDSGALALDWDEVGEGEGEGEAVVGGVGDEVGKEDSSVDEVGED